MNDQQNPLQRYYRTAKLYVQLPSRGAFYDDTVITVPDNGEIAIYSMTAKDEMVMKNPDALLNGEAVAQVIQSCVAGVLKPRALISNDVDALLVAIQGATYGDAVEVKANCPKCGGEVEGAASVEAALESMTILEKTYVFTVLNDLEIEVRPFTYESTVQSGIVNFKSSNSLRNVADITDEMEQLRAFNKQFLQMAALNFSLICDSISKISGGAGTEDEFVVSDRAAIQTFMENCDSIIGKTIEEKIAEVNKIGINRSVQLLCTNEECEEVFTTEVGFDPVNFFTAS